MPQYLTCNHIKTNGNVCQSPALKGSDFCYFHTRDRQRQANFQQAREVKLSRFCPGSGNAPASGASGRGSAHEDTLNAEILESLQLPLLEDANAIQVTLSNLLRAIAGNHVAERRAALLLYGLQIAVSNVANVRLKIWDTDPFALNDPEPLSNLSRFPRTDNRQLTTAPESPEC